MMKDCNKKKKILFITNYPAPYRVEFFNQLGQFTDLTVLFTENVAEQKHRNQTWFNENYHGFKAVFLKETITVKKKRLCWEVLKYLRMPWDCIISGGYADPTQMLAFTWLKAHRVPFYLEMDGGLVKTESYLKYRLKRHFISMPTGWFSSGKATDEYYIHYGARKDGIIPYPFTSMKEADLAEAQCLGSNEKAQLKEKLRMKERYIILTVGQMIYRKGFDVLIRGAESLPGDIGVYIVGGKPTEELMELAKSMEHIHFVDFMPKAELADYYCAADAFVLPTREDIWGLVINEAMSYGLPIITTDRCVAGLELVEDGVNGYIVPVDDPKSLSDAIMRLYGNDSVQMGRMSRERISGYTMEKMVAAHVDFIKAVK